MRNPALPIIALVLVAGACESPYPTNPNDTATVPLRITAVTVGVPISTLVVEVTADDIAGQLVFNLSVVDGVASGTVNIPPGPARVIDVPPSMRREPSPITEVQRSTCGQGRTILWRSG